jgi:hypothetical protein
MPGGIGSTPPASTTASSAKAPWSVNAITRSPGASRSTPGPTSRITPESSLPGENGSGGLNWYLFSMIRTSGKLTLAARTEMST